METPTPENIRESARIFYMTKGHLNTSLATILACRASYTKRLWYNEEAYRYEEGFEDAFSKFMLMLPFEHMKP